MDLFDSFLDFSMDPLVKRLVSNTPYFIKNKSHLERYEPYIFIGAVEALGGSKTSLMILSGVASWCSSGLKPQQQVYRRALAIGQVTKR